MFCWVGWLISDCISFIIQSALFWTFNAFHALLLLEANESLHQNYCFKISSCPHWKLHKTIARVIKTSREIVSANDAKYFCLIIIARLWATINLFYNVFSSIFTLAGFSSCISRNVNKIIIILHCTSCSSFKGKRKKKRMFTKIHTTMKRSA
jgi:hypothetical protein